MKNLLGISGVKGAIIEILSKELPSPLSAKKIYNRVRNGFGLEVTYQAVHKSLKQIMSENVIVRTDRGYALNIEWIRSTKNIMIHLERRYCSVKGKLESMLNRESAITLNFNKTNDVNKFIINEFLNLSNTKNMPLVFRTVHTPWISDEQISLLEEKTDRIKMYMVSNDKSPLDKLLAKNYEAIGAKVKLGVDCARSNDSISFGDFTIQIFKSPDYQKAWNTLYKKVKGMDTLDLKEIRELLYNRRWENLRLVVSRNEAFAEHLRNITLPKFRK